MTSARIPRDGHLQQPVAAQYELSGTAVTRPADVVLDPRDMGGARYTRHSFARTLLRRAAAAGWRTLRERFEMDAAGRGEAVYRVEAEGHVWRFVAFSQQLREDQRTDRVVAESWDVTAALIEGDLDDVRLDALRTEVPRQEAGRADAGTVIWTRANRSERFFEYVAGRLGQGLQPEVEVFGCAPYVLRSTAFYSNGKFGLADFERYEPEHPFAVPYRSHMLAAWLLRELSCDLVEHCAAATGTAPVRLDDEWRRYLGLGNATGLGMVPYVVNHPHVLDAWARLRELPLATVTAREVSPSHPDVLRVLALLERAIGYLNEQEALRTEPYLDGPTLATQVEPIRDLLQEFHSAGTMHAQTVTTPWRVAHDAAADTGPECRGVVASVLVELTAELDEIVERGLRCDEAFRLDPRMRCAELRRLIDQYYGWAADYDFTDPAQRQHFWFSSLNNEEPRRARRSIDVGEEVQHGVDIAEAVSLLRTRLDEIDDELTVAELVLERPGLRAAVVRVQEVNRLEYGEVRCNLLAADFLPLDLQRFQLAVYGMENYSPQSTDWLRVTLFSGAPRAADLADDTADDDWIFTRKPVGGNR